jgi:hypothetical protein
MYNIVDIFIDKPDYHSMLMETSCQGREFAGDDGRYTEYHTTRNDWN